MPSTAAAITWARSTSAAFTLRITSVEGASVTQTFEQFTAGAVVPTTMQF